MRRRKIVHYGIIQSYFCVELIVPLYSHSTGMGIFSNLWLYVTSKVITAPVLTGIEFSPATIFTWKASSSDAARCLKPLSIGRKTLLLQMRVKSLLLPRLVRGTYSKVWPGCRCSALPL